MKTHKALIRSTCFLLIACFLTLSGACSQKGAVSVAPTTTPQLPTVTAMPSPTQIPTQTNIVIDGKGDDWVDRAEFQDDSVGDAEAGFLDLSKGYAFVNQNALYFLITTVDPAAPFVQFDIQFKADEQTYQVSWNPGSRFGYLSNISGEIYNSQFAYATALEGRIDLRDLGSPNQVDLTNVNVMGGKCCASPEWRAVDKWQTSKRTPTINEFDPPRLVSNDLKYQLSRTFELPMDYVADILLAPPLPHLFDIAQSESGVIYLAQWGESSALSRLDPNSGEVTQLIDFSGSNISWMVDGPADTVILKVNTEIWMVSPDGSHEVWGSSPRARPADYLDNGRMIGISDDQSSVVEIFPDGTSTQIAGGFERIFDLVAKEDGVIFLEDFNTGDLVRIDPDGTKTILQHQLIFHDYAALYVDDKADLYVFAPTIGFNQVDQQTGALTRFHIENNPCQLVGSVFVITPEKKALFVNTNSQVVEFDIASGATRPIVFNNGTISQAMTIGPDSALYLGASECPNQPSHVTRIQDDGTNDMYLSGLTGNILDIVFDAQGGLYVATRANDYHVFYLPSPDAELEEIPNPPGGASSLAINPANGNLLLAQWGGNLFEYQPNSTWHQISMTFPKQVNEFWIRTSPDGKVYAYVSERERGSTGPVVNRWILKLDLQNGTSEVVAQHDREGCCVVGNFSIDPQGNFWWLLNPEDLLYKVTPSGEMTLFAHGLPQDSPQVVVDPDGDVYVSGIMGVIRMYVEQ